MSIHDVNLQDKASTVLHQSFDSMDNNKSHTSVHALLSLSSCFGQVFHDKLFYKHFIRHLHTMDWTRPDYTYFG